MNTPFRLRRSQLIVVPLLAVGCGVHHLWAQQAAQPKQALVNQSVVYRNGDFRIAASRGADQNSNRKTVVDGVVIVTTLHSNKTLEVQTTDGGLNLQYSPTSRLAFMPFQNSSLKVEFKGKTTILKDGTGRVLIVKPYPQP